MQVSKCAGCAGVATGSILVYAYILMYYIKDRGFRGGGYLKEEGLRSFDPAWPCSGPPLLLRLAHLVEKSPRFSIPDACNSLLVKIVKKFSKNLIFVLTPLRILLDPAQSPRGLNIYSYSAQVPQSQLILREISWVLRKKKGI